MSEYKPEVGLNFNNNKLVSFQDERGAEEVYGDSNQAWGRALR